MGEETQRKFSEYSRDCWSREYIPNLLDALGFEQDEIAHQVLEEIISTLDSGTTFSSFQPHFAIRALRDAGAKSLPPPDWLLPRPKKVEPTPARSSIVGVIWQKLTGK